MARRLWILLLLSPFIVGIVTALALAADFYLTEWLTGGR
jgi:hypothetical protein